jgi:Carboxypeptidase regulatory-like domain/TonB dependent receptor
MLVCGVVCAFSLLFLFNNSARAQFKASLQGTVMDAGQAAVAGAKVTITNQGTGATREAETSDQGFYRISELPPGRYTIAVEATGFKNSVNKDVEVKAEEPRGFDVTLAIGAVSEQVVVSSSQEALDTENANTGTTIDSAAIDRLPQTGRDPYELLRFTPGVFGDSSRGGNGGANNLPNSTGPGGSNQSIYQTENSVQVVANGQRQDTNNFMIDGTSVNSLQYGGAAVVTPNQQSVQEITVLSNTYSAEDGRTSGAQVKVVSKGGTNLPHGGGFFKYQDPNWNAYNKYGGPNDAPPVRANNNFRQFGGNIGGPIFKDKLFFFFSYEGLRSNSNDVSAPTFVETPQFRDLIVSQRPGSIAATILSSPGIAPRIATVLPATCTTAVLDSTQCQEVAGGLDLGSPSGGPGQYVSLANPTGGGFDGIPDIEYVTLRLPGQNHGNQYNGRFDFIKGKNQFSYSAYFTQVNNISADSPGRSRPQGDLSIEPFNQVNSFSFIRTFSPSVVNEFRVNFTRFNFNQIASSQNVDFGLPRIEIEGYNGFDRIRFGPPQGETTPALFVENSFDIRDTVTKNIQNHTLRMGVDIIDEQNNNNLSGAARPLYVQHFLWNFANDTPIFEAIDANPQTGGPADAQRYLRSKDYAFFFQDDWKLRPNFTLNLGLRYEYFSPFSDVQDRLSNIVFPTDGVLANTSVQNVSRLIDRTMRDAGPRLGFAWSPTRFHGNTVIRGGGGLVFNRPDDVLFQNAAFNPPNYARFSICCGTASTDFGTPFDNGLIQYSLGTSSAYNSFPANPALALGIDPVTGGVCGNVACTPANDTPVEIYGGSSNYRDAYVYVYSTEIEHRLPWNLIATVGYQGSVSHKLTRLVNQNFLQAPNPSFFAVYIPTSDVNANYNALNTRLRRQFSHGLMFDLQYRYAKSIDQLSNEGPGAVTNQTAPAQPQTEHGPSDFDIKHNVSFFALWDLPVFRDQSTFTGKILGGWQVNGIMTWHTGFPWTPVTGTLNSVPITNAQTINPTRPSALLSQTGHSTSNDTFLTPDANFPGIIQQGEMVPTAGGTISAQCSNTDPTTRPGYPYFDICDPGLPGIGRNSYRGPRYFDVDFSVVKKFGLPNNHFWGEGANIELRGNAFNVFNKLNLQPFSFGTDETKIENPLFGQAPGSLSGRVLEFQAKFNF